MQGLILFPATLNKLPLVVIPGVSIGTISCPAIITLSDDVGGLDCSQYLSGELPLPEVCRASWCEEPQARRRWFATNTEKKKQFTLITPSGIMSLLEQIDQLEQRQLKRIKEQFTTTSQLPQDLELKKAVALRNFIKDLYRPQGN